MAWKVVYKITWPNGKAYIGSDLTALELTNQSFLQLAQLLPPMGNL